MEAHNSTSADRRPASEQFVLVLFRRGSIRQKSGKIVGEDVGRSVIVRHQATRSFGARAQWILQIDFR